MYQKYRVNVSTEKKHISKKSSNKKAYARMTGLRPHALVIECF